MIGMQLLVLEYMQSDYIICLDLGEATLPLRYFTGKMSVFALTSQASGRINRMKNLVQYLVHTVGSIVDFPLCSLLFFCMCAQTQT